MDDLLDPMKNPLTYAAPFFLLFVVLEMAALRWLDHDQNLPPTGYHRRDARTSISMGAISVLFMTAFKVGSFFVFTAAFVYLAPWELPTDTWWYWVALLLGLDLCYYWHHRFSHRVRIGWAGHQAHHSSEYMNFGTALRQKWNPWFELVFWMPLPLLGFEPWTLYVAWSVNLIYQFVVHTELVHKMWRPIELVFNTPSHHRVHHGSDPEYLDKNYAGHPDHLGPDVRHLRRGATATEVRPHQAGEHLQPADPGVRPVRRDRPRRAGRAELAGTDRVRARPAGLGAAPGRDADRARGCSTRMTSLRLALSYNS